MHMPDAPQLCRTSSAYGQRSSALPVFHSTSLAKASGAVADAMLRMCNDITDRLSTSGSCGSSVGDDSQGSSATAADRGSGGFAVGQPFDLIPIAQRATMAAAFERAFGIPFPDSVRPCHPHINASHVLVVPLQRT